MEKKKRIRKRKCRHCGQLYSPDPRTRDRQKHCSQPECKRASKAWRQRRWLSKPENKEYFSGPQSAARVKAWRTAHPGYRRKGPKTENVLQDEEALASLRASPRSHCRWPPSSRPSKTRMSPTSTGSTNRRCLSVLFVTETIHRRTGKKSPELNGSQSNKVWHPSTPLRHFSQPKR
jgi:hypothetical protein